MQLTAFTYKLCERMDSSSTVLFIKKIEECHKLFKDDTH